MYCLSHWGSWYCDKCFEKLTNIISWVTETLKFIRTCERRNNGKPAVIRKENYSSSMYCTPKNTVIIFFAINIYNTLRNVESSPTVHWVINIYQLLWVGTVPGLSVLLVLHCGPRWTSANGFAMLAWAWQMILKQQQKPEQKDFLKNFVLYFKQKEVEAWIKVWSSQELAVRFRLQPSNTAKRQLLFHLSFPPPKNTVINVDKKGDF